MARDVARASLYRAPINLWVEDELTRAYLDAVWNSPLVAFLIEGGNEGVQAIVADAEKAGYPNVFAVIDRDFREADKASWTNPNKTSRRFVLPVHEIENYLLDADAPAASRFNNLGETEFEIDAMMATAAVRLCWRAACRDVVAELRKRFRQEFISDLGYPPVASEAQARNHICQSTWFVKLAREVGRTTEADVHQLLSVAHITANQALSDGRWKADFAGKEILRDVGSRICDHTKIPGAKPSSAKFDEDLAKEVGTWQRQNQAVPLDLNDLLAALQQGIARARTKP